MKIITALVAAAALAVVAPVYAHDGKSHPPKSHKCTAHAVSYRISGTLVSGSLAKNSDNTYSGTLTVHVVHADHHAKADKGMDKTYTLDHTRVHLGKNVDPAALAANSRVNLKGRVTKLAKKCDQTGFTPTVTAKKVDIKAPKAPKAPKSATSA